MKQFHPRLIERLHQEAFAIETVVVQQIHNDCRDISNRAANWQPGPMPDDWEPSDVSITIPPTKPRRLFQ